MGGGHGPTAERQASQIVDVRLCPGQWQFNVEKWSVRRVGVVSSSAKTRLH